MNTYIKIALAAALIAIGILGRTIPHSWNFTPMIAIGLLSSAYIGWRYSLGITFATMLITDAIIGFYNPFVMASVYGSIALSALMGRYLAKDDKTMPIIKISFASSVAFFIITNAAVWAFSGMYPLTFGGIAASHTAAIPFFRNMILGDVWYTVLLFSAFKVAAYAIKAAKSHSSGASALPR